MTSMFYAWDGEPSMILSKNWSQILSSKVLASRERAVFRPGIMFPQTFFGVLHENIVLLMNSCCDCCVTKNDFKLRQQ